MRRALITGGASGLGAALVAQALAQGWAVTVIDRAAAPSGFAGRWLVADLADPDAPARLGADLAGPWDLVVLNAGISATGRFEDIPEAAQMAVIAVNLTAPVILSAQLLAAGALARGGRLVLVGSLSSFTGSRARRSMRQPRTASGPWPPACAAPWRGRACGCSWSRPGRWTRPMPRGTPRPAPPGAAGSTLPGWRAPSWPGAAGRSWCPASAPGRWRRWVGWCRGSFRG